MLLFTNTQTVLVAIFSRSTWVSQLLFDSEALVIFVVSFVMGLAKTLGVTLDTIPPGLSCVSLVTSGVCLRCHTSIDPLNNMYKPPQNTRWTMKHVQQCKNCCEQYRFAKVMHCSDNNDR